MPVDEKPAGEFDQEESRVVSPLKQQGMDPPASSAENENKSQDASADGDDAMLDLDQLEELHDEAERMKALGNKHMAAQVRPSTKRVGSNANEFLIV